MTKPKPPRIALYFAVDGTDVFGHLTIGDAHYEIAGLHREGHMDPAARKAAVSMQADMFEKKP